MNYEYIFAAAAAPTAACGWECIRAACIYRGGVGLANRVQCSAWIDLYKCVRCGERRCLLLRGLVYQRNSRRGMTFLPGHVFDYYFLLYIVVILKLFILDVRIQLIYVYSNKNNNIGFFIYEIHSRQI